MSTKGRQALRVNIVAEVKIMHVVSDECV